MRGATQVDFRVLFERAPGLYLVLDRHFFIIAASDEYLHATMLKREDIVGQHLFDVIPDGDEEPVIVDKGTVHGLRRSLECVVREGVPKAAGVQKRNVRGPNGEAIERYWKLLNTPVAGAD